MGDVIAGANPTSVNRPADFGSHQNYLRCVPDAEAFKVPANMPQVAASCMGVVVRTAADAFFNLLHYPLIDEAAHNPEGILLIWGGTTSIGLSTLQFAKARNVATIFAVALPEQFGMLQNMGVTRCFNFMDSDAVDQIRASARELGQPILNVLDAVGSTNARTADSAAACADDNATIVTLTVHPKYSMPLCTMYRDTQLDIDGIGPVFIPKREADGERAAKAFDWAVEHYGNGFEFPRITLNSGYLPLSKEVTSGISGSVDFGKNVIVHPIRDIER